MWLNINKVTKSYLLLNKVQLWQKLEGLEKKKSKNAM